MKWVSIASALALQLCSSVMTAPACSQTAPAEMAIYAEGKRVEWDAMLQAASKADVVFIGELHDHKKGHALELAILQGLFAKNPKVSLSLEMFDRDVQGVLDEYLNSQITESSFLQASRPWPNYKPDYAPMVEYCRTNHLPVFAANAPRRYVNLVSRKGQEALGALPKNSKSYLGRIPYPMDLPTGYDAMLSDLFGGAHGSAAPAPQPAVKTAAPAAPSMSGMPSPDYMKQAQSLWDVTMADSILKARRQYRDRVVVQVNGSGHSDSRWGIVDRLRREQPRLKVLILTIKPDADYLTPKLDSYMGVADYVILTAPEK